jgi:hypothetical protein
MRSTTAVVDVSQEEYEALREAVRAYHAVAAEAGAPAQLLRAFCVCGYPSGPGTLACAAFRKLSQNTAA